MISNISDAAKMDTAAVSNLSTWIDLSAALTILINDGPQASGPRWNTAIVDAVLPLLAAVQDPFSALAKRLSTLIYGAAETALTEAEIVTATSCLISYLSANQKIMTLIDAFKRDGSCREELIAYYQTQLPLDRSNVCEFAEIPRRAILLAHHVQSAGGYLSVLAAYIPIADELGLYAGQVCSSAHCLVEQLESDMGTFVDQAIATFQYGLQKIIKHNQDTCRAERPGWSEYNDYRTDTTIAALDLVSLWRYFNPEKYATATSIRHKHRKLLTLWYTNQNSNQYSNEDSEQRKNPAAAFRGSIAQLEENLNSPEPIRLLNNVTFISATYALPEQEEAACFSGLRQVACNRRSIDGFELDAPGPVTGPPLPVPDGDQIIKESVPFDLAVPTFLSAADFWNGDFPIYWDGSSWHAERVITNFSWYSKSSAAPDSYVRASRSFSLLQEKQPPQAVSTVSASIPSRPADRIDLHPALFTQQLVDFQILYDPDLSTHDYLLGWLDETVKPDLLPLTSHVADASKVNPIEQFHAIAAAKSISAQSLEIIAGPGFTGGDLVSLRAGASIDFILTQDQERSRWFVGAYKVRLWFVKPAADVDIAVMIKPTQGLSSQVNAVIPGTQAVTDLNALQFKDLVSFEFLHDVLIVTSFDQVMLSVWNHSLDASFVLDRVELIFHSTASDPALFMTRT